MDMLGIPALPILSCTSKLSRLIMRQAHQEDHRRSSYSVLAASRRLAWVIRGRKAAELAVKECMVCRLQSSRVNQQLMGDIPSEVTEVSVPFSHISLDLFGPIIVRGIGNRRVSVKVWGALYACLSTKAIAVWAVTGYDAAHFLDAHTRHTSVYGVPQLVLSDHGSQLVAAAKELREWQTVNDMLSRSGTT